MRAAIYDRVSTEDQAQEGQSLETQEDRNRAFCAAQGWTIVEPPYSDDSTGYDTDRPGYKRLLSERAKWDVVVAVKRDRFHRSMDNARGFIIQLRTWGKQAYSIAEGRLDEKKNATMWFADIVQNALPEMEIRQISERVIPSMSKAKEKGLHQGRPPVGFVWVKKLKRFEPTDWALRIQKAAIEYGVTEAGRRNPYEDGKKKGKRVSPTAVRRILANFDLFEKGRLLPNREQTPAGSNSKFREEV